MKTKLLKPYYTIILLCLIATNSFAQWQNLGNTGRYTKMYDNQFGVRMEFSTIRTSSYPFHTSYILRTFDDWLTHDTLTQIKGLTPGCCIASSFHFYDANNGILMYPGPYGYDRVELLKNGNWTSIPFDLHSFFHGSIIGARKDNSLALLDSSFIALGKVYNGNSLVKKLNHNTLQIDTLHRFNQFIGDVSVSMTDDGHLFMTNVWGPNSHNIYHSNDSAKTFNLISTFQSNIFAPSDNLIEFTDSLNGYLTSSFELFHTIDGGLTWNNRSNPLATINVLKAINDSTLIIGGNTLSGMGAVGISQNDGVSWSIDSIPGASEIERFFALDSSTFYLLDRSGYLFKNSMLTGIKQSLNQIKKLSLYPIPAQNQLHFNLKNAQEFQFQVLDLNGRVVQEGRLESNTLNISTLKQGVFFLQLRNVEEVFSSKFIKQ